MKEWIVFILLGLGPGALFAGIALGIVVAYRGSGVINLAMGAMALIGAYCFYSLKTAGYFFIPLPFVEESLDFGGPWSTVPALLGALLVCALTGAAFDFFVLRKLRGSAPLAKLLASLGLLIIIQSVAVLRFGTEGQLAPSALPASASKTVSIFGASVPADRFVLTGIVILAGVLLAVAYRYTRFGLATRAASENETKAVMAGLQPNNLSMANTVIAAVIAGALGVLVAPQTQLDPTTITVAVVPALAAALFARFTSFAIAVAAGLSLGIIESLVTYASSQSWFPKAEGVAIPGVTSLIFFLIIIAVMFWRGSRLPQRGVLVEQRLPVAPPARRIGLPGLLIFAACVVAFLVFPFDFRQSLINTLIGVVGCLSLVVIIGFVGQVSLVQLALAGASAFTVSKVGVHLGIGFPIAALLGALVATVLGTLTALSALRVRGVNLAIVTLAAAVAMEAFVFANPIWGGGASGSPVGSPNLLGIDLGPAASFPINGGQLPSPVFGIFCAAVAVGAGMFVASLRRTDLGQRMLAVRSNESASAAAGINVRNVKLQAFAISSFIAGITGALLAYNFSSVTASRFGLFTALSFVAFAYLGGITTALGATIGGFMVVEGFVGHATNKWLGIPVEYQLLLGGFVLILTIINDPAGIAGTLSAVVRAKSERFKPRVKAGRARLERSEPT
jgi:branched-chain amino acid transport system permease protein